MRDKKFSPTKQSAFDARYEVQKIAFGPVVFQCVRFAWKRGILDHLASSSEDGFSIEALAATGKWTTYALKVVLESCLSAGVVLLKNDRYVLDKAGHVLLMDEITKINFDFIHDVCYRGLFDLARALDEEKPVGLASLGDWPSLYEGLSSFPDAAKKSWIAFDNYYSDTSFPEILPDVFATNPKRLMDIGANTGKFCREALAYHPTVELHLVDLPQQLEMAGKTLRSAHLHERAHFHPIDLLQTELALPGHMDIIWMSQFLSCFSEAKIASILKRATDALAPNGQILIMDTFWDRQRYDIAAYCLINTSPYFTAIASGNSKIYQSQDYIRLAEAAGLKLATIRDNIGFCHSLLRFVKP
ncbi:MAG: class I SAM-dependent methyltransferase [Oxalobacter sp.]|nr:MAG: class I SAM-dependent methyltransferase [Oxalobacter sp.]